MNLPQQMILLSYLLKGNYVTSMGPCRGGDSPENHAGLQSYSITHKACRERCNMNSKCTGFTLHVSNANHCETYTSIGATGTGNHWHSSYTCYMKIGNVIS